MTDAVADYMSSRLFIVGEDFGNSPERYHNDMYALTGASGRRLAELAGVHYLEFYMLTERTNVVELQPHWRDRDLLRAGRNRVLSRMAGRRTIVLGARVAATLGLDHLPLLEWVDLEVAGASVARMPHPSGRNRWWNESDNLERGRAFLTAAVAAT